MSRILDAQPKKRRNQYDRSNLARAYEATLNGMSVYTAARQYSVPESTLRDRTRGNIDVDAKLGHGTLLSTEEEQNLVAHITYMANIGYGYNKSSIQYMAKDYAISLGRESIGRKTEDTEYLSNCWFYGFLKRWPELKVVKPQKLAISRAKSASSEVLSNYYKELGTILSTNNLKDKPERIWNIDESGVSTEHAPPKIVCSTNTNPQAVTSPRGSTVTVIAGGSALGNSIPPYYVFPGQRWNESFLEGAATGASGEMSKSGWSCSSVFQNYLTKHFAKYSNVSTGTQSEPTLVLYDGHRSHISLTLTDWAKKKNVILFVLPPHTSHLTQPLDVAIFGPFKSMYNKECQNFMKNHPGMTITKYQVAALTAKPYIKSLTSENLASAFRKTGIFPFNSSVITESQVAPASIYVSEKCAESSECQEPTDNEKINEDNPKNTLGEDSISTAPATSSGSRSEAFFQDRTITSVIKSKPKRKFIPPFLAGNLLKKSNINTLQLQEAKKAKLNLTEKQKTQAACYPSKSKVLKFGNSNESTSKKSTRKINVPIQKNVSNAFTPLPCTSGLNRQGEAINLISTEDTDDDSLNGNENSNCCVCGLWEPAKLRDFKSVKLVNWAECDVCGHWTHLQFCSTIVSVNEGSEFRCPHCLSCDQ